MINSVINIFKYPIAMLFFLWLIELGAILWNIIYTMMQNQAIYTNFFIGIGVYLLMWFILFRERIGRLFLIFEHEITHALFALISFNKITEIRVGMINGYMRFLGGKREGNWLISIAPYFFSTLGVIIIGLIHLASPVYYPILMGVLGYILVHHIHTIIVMIHPYQSDIQEEGYPFSFLFLPGANLLMIIVILTQIPGDSIYLSSVVDYLYDITVYYFEQLVHFLGL